MNREHLAYVDNIKIFGRADFTNYVLQIIGIDYLKCPDRFMRAWKAYCAVCVNELLDQCPSDRIVVFPNGKVIFLADTSANRWTDVALEAMKRHYPVSGTDGSHSFISLPELAEYNYTGSIIAYGNSRLTVTNPGGFMRISSNATWQPTSPSGDFSLVEYETPTNRNEKIYPAINFTPSPFMLAVLRTFTSAYYHVLKSNN